MVVLVCQTSLPGHITNASAWQVSTGLNVLVSLPYLSHFGLSPEITSIAFSIIRMLPVVAYVHLHMLKCPLD